MSRLAVGLCVAAILCLSGCSGAEKEQQRLGITPTYDRVTGKLRELTYDSNQNGRVDTWTDMDGTRPVRSRIDRNEDGRLDRWEYYGADGQLQKVGFSRNDDGKADAWAFSGADGKVERIEISSSADESRIDRRERYDASGLVAAEEDTNGDGATDKWETYQAASLETVAFDENGDAKPDRRMTYRDGALVLIETQPDASGAYSTRVVVR